ncbi:MAG: alpha/beta hydrolase [Lentisphaeria bacterium]|nr:alpha/beta hydrolase [Lentisphaeria bacterium]
MNWKRKNRVLLRLAYCGALALPLLRLLAIPHVFDTGPVLIREVYVDSMNGSDGNSGDSSGAAFKTLGAAVTAIQASQCDGTVHVLPGTYFGEGNRDLDFGGRNIHIVSTAGAESTVVDLGGMGAFLSLHGGGTAGSSLEGLTIRNGVDDGSAVIDLEGASLAIAGCVLSGNEGRLGAVSVSGGSLSLSDTVLSGNYAWDGAGALNASADASVAVTGCDFQGNFGYYASAVLVDFADADFAQCVFQGNSCMGTGAAVVVRSDDADDCLGLENCLVQGNQDFDGPYGLSGVAAYGAAGLSLLNCTVQGEGTVLHAEGTALLDNSIVEGEMYLPQATLADNNYTPENLDDYGYGNLQGDDPGVNPDGTLTPDSPCIDSGSVDYASGTDISGAFRDDGLPDIGCTEFKSDSSDSSDKSAPSAPSDKSGSNKPSDEYNPYHYSEHAFKPGYVTLTCGELRAAGKDYGALKSLLEGKFASQLEWDCHWSYSVPVRNEYGRIVDYNYGTQDCTAQRISPWLDDFQDTIGRHPVFSDQFSPWFCLGRLHYGCSEDERTMYVGAEIAEHELGWTGKDSEDYPCFMAGLLPDPDNGFLAKPRVNVPLGLHLRLRTDWGGDEIRPCAEPWEYDAPVDAGCKVLKAMSCLSCGMERRIDPDPMPSWNSRVLYHRDCYFTPEVSDEEYPAALAAAKAVSARCRYGGAYFWETAALNLEGTGASSWNRDYTTVCDRTGRRRLTFRKACLGVTVHKDDYRSHMNCGSYTPNLAIPLQSCGESALSYDVTTVGIGGLAADGGTATALVRDASGDFFRRYLLMPSRIDQEEEKEFHARARKARAAGTATFQAAPEGGAWPTEADYPTGEYPKERNDWSWTPCWRFPRWSLSGSGIPSYGDIRDDDGSALLAVAKAVQGGEANGQATLEIPFDLGTGRYLLTSSCHADEWWWRPANGATPTADACQGWNLGEKSWNVLACDIRVDMLEDKAESPLPLLLLNDDYDDDDFVKQKLKAKEVFWTEDSLKADLDRTGPISYIDDDLKAVKVTVPDVFGGDRELLKRLWIRVKAENGIRFYGDEKKNAPDARSWTKEDNGADGAKVGENGEKAEEKNSWLFRVLPPNEYGARFSCQLFAEGVKQGEGIVTATLLLADESNGQDARPGFTPVVADAMEVSVIRVALVPDYGRDGSIDDADRVDALKGRPLRMWYNDNTDIDGFNLWDFENDEENKRVSHVKYNHPETNRTSPNCNDGIVNGRGDLLDLFPVWLDAKDFLILNGGEWEPQVALSHARNEIQAVYSDLAPGAVKDFRHQDGHRGYSAKGDDALHEASVHGLGEEFPAGFLDECRNGNGVLLCEGHSPTDTTNESCINAVFQLVRKNADGSKTVHTVGRCRLNTSVSPVSAMYRYYSLRGCEKDPAKSATRVNGAAMPGATGVDVSEPANMPDNETDPVYFAFVHGFNVDEKESGNWQGRMFKRLYQTGANVRLVGIDWNGDYSCQWNYHTNAEHAFRTAGALKECVTELASKGGKVFLLGHSLGNMLVSSAIVDRTMAADGFFMLNAAVAAEAYDPERHNTCSNMNRMVPKAWRKYPFQTWSAEWYSHFPEGDDRSRLTWKGRFEAMLHAPGTGAGAKLTVYNYFDSQDEVIGTFVGDNPADDEELWVTDETGIGRLLVGKTGDFDITSRQFAWHKQEFTKGRRNGFHWLLETGFGKYLKDETNVHPEHEDFAYTDEAGWGFQEFERTGRRHSSRGGWQTYRYSARKSVKEAKAMKDNKKALQDFNQAVFLHNPAYMAQPTISQKDQDHLLAFGIPALSGTAGSGDVGVIEKKLDISSKKNAWQRDDAFCLHGIWAHSDYMIMPYFCTYGLYEEIVKVLDPSMAKTEQNTSN